MATHYIEVCDIKFYFIKNSIQKEETNIDLEIKRFDKQKNESIMKEIFLTNHNKRQEDLH